MHLAGIVGDAVDDLDRRASILPAQQADAAAFSAKIDGDEGACVGRGKRPGGHSAASAFWVRRIAGEMAVAWMRQLLEERNDLIADFMLTSDL